MQPDVSVLMAVRNPMTAYPEDTFKRSALSLSNPVPVNVELCLVDDASDDEIGIPLIHIWGLQSAKEAVHDERKGPAAAYQTAAEMSTGRYCILQSVRSWYEPGSFLEMVDYLDAHPEVGFVYGETQYHGASRNRHIPPPYLAADFDQRFVSLFGVMFRREAFELGCRFEKVGDFDGVPVDVCDYDFVLQMIKRLGWKGHKLTRLVLNYHYSGRGQQTDHVHANATAVQDWLFERWGIRPCV